jgi:enoyl-CoA hydratase/carnithine racemase
MAYSDLLIAEEADLVLVTMNRPPANALNNSLILQLLEQFRLLAARKTPPGLVLTGGGDRFFSAGGDIKEVSTVEISTPRMKSFHALLCEMESYPAPFVCGVRGYAVGGAFEFLLHADYVVANSQARVGFPEINHGLLPAAKGMRQAAVKLGQKVAKSLLYSGELVDAAHAMTVGAIDEIVETNIVTDRSLSVCRQLLSKDRRLFAAIKRSITQTGQVSDEDLDAMTVADLSAYLESGSSAAARAKFLGKGKRPE